MSKLSTIVLAVLAGGSLAAATQTAVAAEPATVTVRVEGSSRTLLPATVVTTNATPVVKDGKPEDSCPGTNAIGALEQATGGNWSGPWFKGLGYSWETILGESHTYPSTGYWGFWFNGAFAEQGICGQTLKTGDSLLFAPVECEECTPAVLGVEAPASAAPATPVQVTVVEYGPSGTPTPAAGATVTFESHTTQTDGSGHAGVTFAATGAQEVTVTKSQAIRDETSICLQPAGAGCGAATPASGVAGFTASAAPYKGPFALVADVTSIVNGRHYTRAAAPRLISGQVSAHSAVTAVSLSLRRSFRGRCSAFDATRGRFVKARCGSAPAFPAAKQAAFSYLLPGKLGPGRYVLDVQASDTAGNTLTLARGTSRVVFYVR